MASYGVGSGGNCRRGRWQRESELMAADLEEPGQFLQQRRRELDYSINF